MSDKGFILRTANQPGNRLLPLIEVDDGLCELGPIAVEFADPNEKPRFDAAVAEAMAMKPHGSIARAVGVNGQSVLFDEVIVSDLLDSNVWTLPPKTRLEVGLAVARGVEHLHSQGVYGILCGSAFLGVTAALEPKILMYGKLLEAQLYSRRWRQGRVGDHQEALICRFQRDKTMTQLFSKEGDLYSVGTLLYELWIGNPIFGTAQPLAAEVRRDHSRYTYNSSAGVLGDMIGRYLDQDVCLVRVNELEHALL